MTIVTVRAKLPRLQISGDITVAGVTIRRRKTCISLATQATRNVPGSFVVAEERLLHIAQSIELLHHQTTSIQIDKETFPSRHSSRFRANPQTLDRNLVSSVTTALNAHPQAGELKSIWKVLCRADEGDTWLEQFIFKWMAFNTLYGMYAATHNERERDQIDNFIDRSTLTDAELKPWVDLRINQQGFSFLIAQGLTLGLGNNPTLVSTDLATALANLPNTQDYRDFATKAILVVYALRNRFFHGNAPAIQVNQMVEVSEAVALLDFVIRATIQKQLGLPPSGPLSAMIEHITVAFDEFL